MIKLSVEPRTTEWHEARNGSWTASAAAVLVCKPNAEALRDYAALKGVVLDIEPLLAVGIESFYGNTLWKAWAEKMGNIPRFKGNVHTARGTSNEELIVAHFEASQMMMVTRDVTAFSTSEPGLLASFDALAPASSDPSVAAPYGFPVEAKCPAFHSRKKLWDSKKAGSLAIMGLPYYWCQVQHQILVAQAPYGWFVAAGVEVVDGATNVVFPIVEKVPRDDNFLKAYLAAAKFYHKEFIENFNEPPKLPEDIALIAELTETAHLELALVSNDSDEVVSLYLQAVQAKKSAAERLDKLEVQLLKAATAVRAEGSDVVLLGGRIQVVYATSNTVSWQKVAKELAGKLGGMPADTMAACTSSKESIKVKEIA